MRPKKTTRTKEILIKFCIENFFILDMIKEREKTNYTLEEDICNPHHLQIISI